MIRFHAPDIAQTCTLPESDSKHCVRVLRMKEGDELEIVDGFGRLYRCTLAVANQHHAIVKINQTVELPKVWRPDITVAIAPTKHIDRMEWTVEKLVEIGIDRIVPLRCRRSERKEINIERLRKIAVSAMKQSLKAILPRIDDITPLPDFLKQCRAADRFIAYCDDSVERHLLSRLCRPDTDTTLLIGPEGDFAPEEVQAALVCGFRPVTLGDNRLRTETAALVAVDTVHIINQLAH